MKNLIATLVLTLTSTVALAHPGGHKLMCKSTAQSGGKQVTEFTLTRSNGINWYAPKFSLKIDGKQFDFASEDESSNYGETFHNTPMGVITVTANNFKEATSVNYGSFSVVAIPNTVKAYDPNGQPVKWNFNDEKDECYDTNGKAKFKAIFKGSLRTDRKDIPVDTEYMDCELEYNSGMAC